MRRLPLFQLLAGAGIVLVGALSFLDVFTASAVLPMLIGAAFLPAVLAVVTRGRRPPHLWLSTVVSLGVLVVYLAVTVFRSSSIGGVLPTGGTFSGIVDGLRNGWREILSASVPSPARPNAVFVPVAATWIASFVTAELICRTRRVFLVALPALAVAVLGALFSDPGSGTALGPMTLFVAAGAILIAARSSGFAGDDRPFDRREERWEHDPEQMQVSRALWRQRVMVAIPFVLVVVLVAPPLARLLPFVDTSRQTSLREHYEIPLDRQRDINPLAQLAGTADDDVVRFRVTVDEALPGKARFATQVLDQFDGAQWRSSGQYVLVGDELPVGDDLPTKSREVRQQVEVVDADGPALPSLQRAVAVDAPASVEVQADPITGMLVAKKGEGKVYRYSVVSRTGDYSPDDIVAAGVATVDSARSSVAPIDQLPPELAKVRDEVMAKASSPFQQLARLLAFFRNDKRVNTSEKAFTVQPDAGGFTLGQIAQFVKADGTRSGRPEQFAAAFATLARAQGFPARIVVGYVPPDPLAAGNPVALRDRDRTAWVEVALGGFGWVPFDPAPTEKSDSQVNVQEQQLDAAVDSAVDSSVNQPQDVPAENPNAGQGTSSGDDGGGRVPVVLAVAAVVLLALVLLLLTPWLRKRRRRDRRRHAPDPAERVAGAWQEAMDRLTEAGVEHPESLTTAEATSVAAERFGEATAEPLAGLGPIVNRALHAEDPPPEAAADEAWRRVDEFVGRVRGASSRRDRIRASLDRRPLAARGDLQGV